MDIQWETLKELIPEVHTERQARDSPERKCSVAGGR